MVKIIMTFLTIKKNQKIITKSKKQEYKKDCESIIEIFRKIKKK